MMEYFATCRQELGKANVVVVVVVELFRVTYRRHPSP